MSRSSFKKKSLTSWRSLDIFVLSPWHIFGIFLFVSIWNCFPCIFQFTWFSILFCLLIVLSFQCIYGCYVHSAILPTFHRRCYWLLQVRVERKEEAKKDFFPKWNFLFCQLSPRSNEFLSLFVFRFDRIPTLCWSTIWTFPTRTTPSSWWWPASRSGPSARNGAKTSSSPSWDPCVRSWRRILPALFIFTWEMRWIVFFHSFPTFDF